MKIHVIQVLVMLSCIGELLQRKVHGNLFCATGVLRSEQGQITVSSRTGWQSKDVCGQGVALLPRPHSVTITEFGAVGDGLTLNTHAFQNAIFYTHSFADKGGAQLYVPAGRWLTGSFNLTSHLTLFLEKDAVILGSEDPSRWPVIDPLPSYGRGRELPGGRYISLIHGVNLTDVIITGDNGTIDGQGSIWWDMFQNKTLDYTRGHLVELINSQDVVISNLTFQNSPFWTIHPVYCSNVLIQNVTILAPHDSPNTDGINPDSSSGVCVSDCFISNGDDAIAIKSGWDEYGIGYGRPSSNILIRRVTADTPGSGIAFGSEMSGGISDVSVEDMSIYNAAVGINLKTCAGRGGYVKDILISGVKIVNAKIAIGFTGFYDEHPDSKYDPDALPVVERISIESVDGQDISIAGKFHGIPNAPFREICLADILLNGTSSDPAWICSYVQGFSESVVPEPCPELQNQSQSLLPSCFSSDDIKCKDL